MQLCISMNLKTSIFFFIHHILNKHACILFFFWKRSTTCIHSILTTNETHLYSIHTYFLYYIFLTIQHTYILDRIGGFNSCEISNLSPNLQIDQRKMHQVPMCAPCVYAIILLMYYNKNIINWLTMNTKCCIWVMFGIYRKYRNNNSSNWLTMYC